MPARSNHASINIKGVLKKRLEVVRQRYEVYWLKIEIRHWWRGGKEGKKARCEGEKREEFGSWRG